MPRIRRPLPIVAALALIAAGVTAVVVASNGDETTTRSASTTTGPTTTTSEGTGTSPAESTASSAPAHHTGRFRVVGSDIVDPDGNVFVPMGANVAVRQGGFEEGYAFNWNGTATDHAADVAAWGWNTVRATVVCTPDEGPTDQEVYDGVDAFLREYTSRRIVVIVECHDITGEDLAPDDPRVDAVLEFVGRVAAEWGDEPYVWFNPVNEPQTDTTPSDVANWTAIQARAYERVRAAAPHSVFIADLPGWGQGLSTLTGSAPVTSFGAERCNVVYGWHAYGAVGQDEAFGSPADDSDEAASLDNHRAVFEFLRAERIPVIIGEFGDPLTLDEGTAGQPIWNRLGARSVIQLAPEYGVGLIWWHGTGDSGIFLTYSLMAERHEAPWTAATTGEGLSDGGRRFWEASKRRAEAAPTPFAGDLSTAGCPD